MSSRANEDLLTLSLDKPLGLILEESSDGVGGVVAGINEGGSVYRHPSRDTILGLRIAMVTGADVRNSNFDDIMDAIVGASSPVEISFALSRDAIEGNDVEVDDSSPLAATASAYEVGSLVTITVQQPNKSDILLRSAKVGDNLRKTLLSNPDIELYRGLKKKLGNCGGGGQCGFCAVELIDDSGVANVWGMRSEYEAKKIGKNGGESCRLACMNNIIGPATVRTL